MNEASSTNPIITIVVLALVVFIAVSQWIIFQKAGEAGWKSIIPFYNTYTLFKFSWGNGWLFLLMFVPVANVVVSIIFAYKFAKAFGHGIGFCLLYLFLPVIALPVLAFGSSRYIGPA